jgi:hypothetical protein
MSLTDLLRLMESIISPMKKLELSMLPQQRWTTILCRLSLFGDALISRSFVKQEDVISGKFSTVIGNTGSINEAIDFCVASGET